MTATRLFATTTAIAALASAGVASAADAPIVSAQATYTGKTAPMTIPGTGVQKGEKLPRGARLVYRTVTLEGAQKVTLTLRAPSGKTLRGLVPQDSDTITFVVVTPRNYGGRRQVKVRALTRGNPAEESSARIYALTR